MYAHLIAYDYTWSSDGKLTSPSWTSSWGDQPASMLFYYDAEGRPAFYYVMMFKIIVLLRTYNLSDDQIEYRITDRLSFQRFLGISLGDKVPDAKTIWLFRETLRQSGAFDIREKSLKNCRSTSRTIFTKRAIATTC